MVPWTRGSACGWREKSSNVDIGGRAESVRRDGGDTGDAEILAGFLWRLLGLQRGMRRMVGHVL